MLQVYHTITGDASEIAMSTETSAPRQSIQIKPPLKCSFASFRLGVIPVSNLAGEQISLKDTNAQWGSIARNTLLRMHYISRPRLLAVQSNSLPNKIGCLALVTVSRDDALTISRNGPIPRKPRALDDVSPLVRSCDRGCFGATIATDLFCRYRDSHLPGRRRA